ncbi:MAG TPA: glycosyltransferase family 39 protein [Patescibacteria group bacterium]|nr:glycosyltransferase family 39 protein [Patescibacteria group bacterium]
MFKKIINNLYAPFVFGSGLFIYLQLQIYNLGLNFRDEGFSYLNAVRILNGDIPYRDFFMTTTPGSFYLLALAIKIFGLALIEARIIYIVLVVICLFFVSLTYKIKQFNKYVLLIGLGLMFLGPSAIASYNIGALTLSVISFYFLSKGLDRKKGKLIFISGLVIGIVFLFKQSYGIWIGLGFLYLILIERFKKFGFKDKFIANYILGGLVSTVPFLIYLYINHALTQFIYYSGTFSRMVKAHRTPFILKSLISIPLMYIILKYFVPRVSKKLIYIALLLILIAAFLINFKFGIHYFELSRIYYGLLIFFPLLALAWVKPNNKVKMIYRVAIFLLVLFLANASSGRELGTVMWVSPVFFPLIILVIEYLSAKYKKINIGVFNFAATILILIQALYFSWNSINPNGRVYVSYKKSELKYELSEPQAKGIKVSHEDKKELDYVISKINKYPKNKKLLCFPYCPLMSVITNRDNTSYYNFFYPEAFLPEDQPYVIDELKKTNSIIVIQKVGKLELEANLEDKRFGKLKKYLMSHYKKAFETKDFIVYQ